MQVLRMWTSRGFSKSSNESERSSCFCNNMEFSNSVIINRKCSDMNTCPLIVMCYIHRMQRGLGYFVPQLVHTPRLRNCWIELKVWDLHGGEDSYVFLRVTKPCSLVRWLVRLVTFKMKLLAHLQTLKATISMLNGNVFLGFSWSFKSNQLQENWHMI
jgi:hypothetical protein